MLNKSPKFYDFFSLLFKTVFYSKQSSISEFTVHTASWYSNALTYPDNFYEFDNLCSETRLKFCSIRDCEYYFKFVQIFDILQYMQFLENRRILKFCERILQFRKFLKLLPIFENRRFLKIYAIPIWQFLKNGDFLMNLKIFKNFADFGNFFKNRRFIIFFKNFQKICAMQKF